MKKHIGNALALYPTPLVVVGAMLEDGKPNWLLVGHLGIMGHDHVMVSLASTHYTNAGIKSNKSLSINIVDEALLKKADYVGCVIGSKTDKSNFFVWHLDGSGAPILDEAPVSMACVVKDVYEPPGFESFICTIAATYAEEAVLNPKGKIDYHTLKPVEKLTAAMREIGEKYDASVAQIAIAWAIAKGATPLIGVTKPQHVEDAARAAEIRLAVDEVAELERMASQTGVDTRGSWESPMI